MKFLKKIDKVLAAFGNMRALERNHVDTFTENLIQNIPGNKIAESNEGQIWTSFQNLAGYYFLNTTVLSHIKIRSTKGTKLMFCDGQNNFMITSDSDDINSNFSNISKCWITKINYIINKEQLKNIKKNNINKIKLSYKKKTLTFFGNLHTDASTLKPHLIQ
ncbi:hypothetical protein [Cellulophaga sp. Z1A5H]|uniref:hypothetical protein n=1 Tax=Cellulophaga sp. Z1A5H TaxID=2687291 RepID=UPI0013FDBE0D|nr:hypothetical protein [Cellulophaga sp. Z1A5H]